MTSYASLFVGSREKKKCKMWLDAVPSVMKRTRLAPISVTTELKLPKPGWLSGGRGERRGGCLPAVFDILGGE